MPTINSWFLCCMLCAAATAAGAQAPPAPATPPQATAPPPSPNTADCAPNGFGSGVTVGQSGEALGDKLAKSNGVLCPPSGVDPHMHAPTPENSGKMPVIPPPGSPGGNSTVQPK
jgi:hypothetical protein